jgi:hypothetical protein
LDRVDHPDLTGIGREFVSRLALLLPLPQAAG